MGNTWALELSTAEPTAAAGSQTFEAQTHTVLPARSVLVLKRVA
jgi:hypothetical protein